MWTRSFIISAAENLKDVQPVTERLLRNPSDFADFLEPFYGTAASERFEELLREHLLLAADLLKSAKAGDSAGADTVRKKWYANADSIASLLASVNPYWSFEIWQRHLYDHLGLVEQEATERLNKEYAKDIAIFGPMEEQALTMADLMSEGIIMQFGI
jgi:hypothetical protein